MHQEGHHAHSEHSRPEHGNVDSDVPLSEHDSSPVSKSRSKIEKAAFALLVGWGILAAPPTKVEARDVMDTIPHNFVDLQNKKIRIFDAPKIRAMKELRNIGRYFRSEEAIVAKLESIPWDNPDNFVPLWETWQELQSMRLKAMYKICNEFAALLETPALKKMMAMNEPTISGSKRIENIQKGKQLVKELYEKRSEYTLPPVPEMMALREIVKELSKEIAEIDLGNAVDTHPQIGIPSHTILRREDSLER